MMLYLTGASSSITKSEEVAQTDVTKSLGGYISSSPVPNGALNTLFDCISLKTIKDKAKETIALGLVNKLSEKVRNITLKLVTEKENNCAFRVAAVAADKNLCIEHINNRYSEPINAKFYDVSFYRAAVDVEIVKTGTIGESISLEPFGVILEIKAVGYDGIWNAVVEAFSADKSHRVKRLTEKVFRIERTENTVVETPITCSYLATDKAELKFLTDFQNYKNNEVLISENLDPNEGIGIWIQRELSEFTERTNEQMIEDYDEKKQLDTIENVELVINYEIGETETETPEIDSGETE